MKNARKHIRLLSSHTTVKASSRTLYSVLPHIFIHKMNDGTNNPPSILRKRSVGIDAPTTPNLPLSLDVGYKVVDGGVIRGTPSPSCVKIFTEDDPRPTSSLIEFRKKQQSFEIHIEDCDEEEMSGSDDENMPISEHMRPRTPAQILEYPDYSGNITYKEQPSPENFLRVGERDQECVTDVSEGESDNEVDTEDDPNLIQNSVIKRVP